MARVQRKGHIPSSGRKVFLAAVCNVLASGETSQSFAKDVDLEWVVARNIDVHPQIKLASVDEVGVGNIPAKGGMGYITHELFIRQ